LKERIQRLLQRKFIQDTLALQVGKAITTAIGILSSVLVIRLMEPSAFGVWALVQSFFIIWQTPNLTGVGPSTSTRLAIAIGARNDYEILNNMAFYVKVSFVWTVFSTVTIAIFGQPIASAAYEDGGRIGVMAFIYTLNLMPDAIYGLVVIALQGRRSMRAVAFLQNLNSLTLAACYVGALLISPTAESLVIARLVYAVATMLIALAFYARLRERDAVPYPSMRAVIARARSVPVRPYWRFGVANALDKNLTSLFMEVPMQIVGIVSGNTAAGYLEAILKGIHIIYQLTSAIFENMQAVIPQAVGRGDYSGLWRNFRRVMGILIVGAVGFYTVFALAALLFGNALIPLIYGAHWLPVVPLMPVMAVYGAVVTIGGVFGPLYRALRLMRQAIIVKIITLVVVVPPGVWLVEKSGALGGGWLVNVLFGLSVLLTALVALPKLRQLATPRIEYQMSGEA
jgi:O-antigen/teichoic acid export membrane protein